MSEQIQITHQGLTFLHHVGGKVTVWEGEPADSRLVATSVVDGMVMGAEGPMPLGEVIDEELFRSWADEWLAEHPEYRPLTAQELEAREALAEVLQDILSDPEVIAARGNALTDVPQIQAFVQSAAAQMTRIAQAKIVGGSHPQRAGAESLFEALTGCVVAGFVAGQTFQQRGYRL